MYDYENALKAYVQGPGASSGVEYTVECEYGIQYYSLTMGFTVPGASGNPFCLFPAPAGLWLSAKLNGKTPLSLGDLCPGVDLGAAAAYPRLWVPNGGYKQYTGVTHIANSCWAADSTTMATIQPGAKAYAHHLQHI
jgi:hypothetical protein